jgi:predicted tellurium resistance membrane protein TerC
MPQADHRVGGRRPVTPLVIVFVTIGGTDILFALDSIPAVFGVTDQPYIVFAANAFARLGLRALFFPVTGLLGRLVNRSSGLALILAFIGAIPSPGLTLEPSSPPVRGCLGQHRPFVMTGPRRAT